MTLFSYKAITDTGAAVSGQIEAETRQMAMELIAQKGLIPEKVKKAVASSQKGDGKLSQLLSPVKPYDIVLYTMQLKTLLQSGVPIIQIFQILEVQTENRRLKAVTTQMREKIRQGASLYDAFKDHEGVFSRLYTAMIRAGEVSGALPEVLERVIYITQHEDKVRSDITSALRYPMVVMALLLIAFFVLLTFVVPKFVALFQGAGLELPWATKLCMALYFMIANFWQYGLILTFVLAAVVIQVIRSERGGRLKDALMLHLPLFGSLLVKSVMSRFASIFAILQSSGISALDSLKILGEAIGNKAVASELSKIHDRLIEGTGISAPLREARYFPSLVINMVAIGEESGSLDVMLKEIARHYDVEVEYATKKFSEALGPVLVVGLSAVVGFFAFAIFLPMWDLAQMVQ